MRISSAGCDFGLKTGDYGSPPITVVCEQTVEEAPFSATAIFARVSISKGKTAEISKTVEN